MDLEAKIEYLLKLCDTLEIPVRLESLGGNGGGLCRLKGQSIVFVDLDADPQTRYEKLIEALRRINRLENVYLVPEIREDLGADER